MCRKTAVHKKRYLQFARNVQIQEDCLLYHHFLSAFISKSRGRIRAWPCAFRFTHPCSVRQDKTRATGSRRADRRLSVRVASALRLWGVKARADISPRPGNPSQWASCAHGPDGLGWIEPKSTTLRQSALREAKRFCRARLRPGSVNRCRCRGRHKFEASSTKPLFSRLHDARLRWSGRAWTTVRRSR